MIAAGNGALWILLWVLLIIVVVLILARFWPR